MKKVKNIIFLAVIVAYIIMITGFISDKEKELRITGLRVSITDSLDNQFICSEDIYRILDANNFAPVGKDYRQVDLTKIEKILRSRQIISHAEAFITEPGIVHIEISQKTPFVRIFNRYGQTYYLDRQGNIIPWTHGYSPFVIVANGYISEPFKLNNTLNIMDVKHDSISRPLHTVYDIYRLADFITSDDFWNSQIEQIYVNNKYEIELIPRVGSQIIELGTVENLEEKFDNLWLLYEKGFNNLGWNQYEKISLKYKNQVVCTKIQ